jgi:predicted transcriptional regulator
MGTLLGRSLPVRLDPELRPALDDRAVEEKRPAAEVIREALRRYLAVS